jgi:anti-sigma B factor antagonist
MSESSHCVELLAADHAVILELHGEIDIYSATDFKLRMREAVGGSGLAVVVDLSDVTFIDSSGLSVLVFGEQRLRQRGAVLHIVCDERIRRVLSIAGLNEALTLYEDRDEALRAALTASDGGPGETRGE